MADQATTGEAADLEQNSPQAGGNVSGGGKQPSSLPLIHINRPFRDGILIKQMMIGDSVASAVDRQIKVKGGVEVKISGNNLDRFDSVGLRIGSALYAPKNLNIFSNIIRFTIPNYDATLLSGGGLIRLEFSSIFKTEFNCRLFNWLSYLTKQQEEEAKEKGKGAGEAGKEDFEKDKGTAGRLMQAFVEGTGSAIGGTIGAPFTGGAGQKSAGGKVGGQGTSVQTPASVRGAQTVSEDLDAGDFEPLEETEESASSTEEISTGSRTISQGGTAEVSGGADVISGTATQTIGGTIGTTASGAASQNIGGTISGTEKVSAQTISTGQAGAGAEVTAKQEVTAKAQGEAPPVSEGGSSVQAKVNIEQGGQKAGAAAAAAAGTAQAGVRVSGGQTAAPSPKTISQSGTGAGRAGQVAAGGTAAGGGAVSGTAGQSGSFQAKGGTVAAPVVSGAKPLAPAEAEAKVEQAGQAGQGAEISVEAKSEQAVAPEDKEKQASYTDTDKAALEAGRVVIPEAAPEKSPATKVGALEKQPEAQEVAEEKTEVPEEIKAKVEAFNKGAIKFDSRGLPVAPSSAIKMGSKKAGSGQGRAGKKGSSIDGISGAAGSQSSAIQELGQGEGLKAPGRGQGEQTGPEEGPGEKPPGESPPTQPGPEQAGGEGAPLLPSKQDEPGSEAPGKTEPGKDQQDQKQKDQQAQEAAQAEEQDVAESQAQKAAAAIKKSKDLEKQVEEAIAAGNKLLNAGLQRSAASVWATALPSIGVTLIVGAIAGDFILAFKSWFIKRIINTVAPSEELKAKAEEIGKKIKINRNIKMQILAMNLIPPIFIILFVAIVFIVGCNTPSSASSVMRLAGYGQYCDALESATGIGALKGALTPAPTAPSPVGGKCSPVSVGPATPEALSTTCLAPNAMVFSILANIESGGGDPAAESGSDMCKDGNSFSIGLYQINLISHGSKLGASCSKNNLFQINGTGTAQGNCLQRNSNGVCLKYDCQVTNLAQYQTCKNMLKNPATNINIACQLSGNGSNLQPWVYSKNLCGL